MDISSAMSQHASKKQLRRFAAALGLQADDPGSLSKLLALPAAKLSEAAKSISTPPTGAKSKQIVKLKEESDALIAVVLEWQKHGPPEEAEVEDTASEEEHIVVPKTTTTRPTPKPGQCVDCLEPADYVFVPWDIRLCERCEKQNPKYMLIDAATAMSIHGLDSSDLGRLRGWAVNGNKRQLCYLRSDVEKLADGQTRNQRAESDAAWRQGTFKVDARTGRTKKWKPMNTHTYHHKQAAKKEMAAKSGTTCEFMDLSGLIYKPL